ncbi:MAG: pectate lyase [Thermogutta sp.]
MLRRKFCQLAFLTGGMMSLCGQRSATGESRSGTELRTAALDALQRAVKFFDEEVSIEGGYVWAYAEDLSLREGEGNATAQTAWVQPPGTPTVGMTLLTAYRLTKQEICLRAAERTAHALVQGQLASGGWDYRIEFDPQVRTKYRYRKPPAGGEKAHNTSNLDDDTTQSALRFLMEYDREIKMQDEAVHEAVRYGLSVLLAVQRPNGGWPQRFVQPPDPKDYPDIPASYPADWPRRWPSKSYYDCYTINDNTQADTVRTVLLAWRIYEDNRYLTAACRGGEFLIKSQMPDPQPAWAQQYNAQMQPCWARKFEPPAITGGESQGVMRTLLLLFHETGDKRFLEPIPRAIEYLRRSVLPDGRLARFYELKTNRPLFFTRDYQLTYQDTDTPTHYAFKCDNQLDSIQREYEQALKAGPRPGLGRLPTAPRFSASLETQVRQVVEQLDQRGRWVEQGRLKTAPANASITRILTTRTFVRNLEILASYLAASQT